jgi:inner membrane protein
VVGQNGIAQTVAGYVLVSPETGAADSTLTTEMRQRGLQRVPVYTSETTFEASFNAERVLAATPSGARLRWPEAALLISMADSRGVKEARFQSGNEVLEFSPAEATSYPSATGGTLTYRRLFAAPVPWIEDVARRSFPVTGVLSTSGAERMALAAFARDTTVTLKASGEGAVPSFEGGVLPDSSAVNPSAFEATWRVPYLARGMSGAAADLSLDTLIGMAPAVKLLDVSSPYKSVERALKYAPMFLGLVFLTYFLFETRMRRRVHPAQYVLVGLAQLVFYLLLLSVSEILGFNLGFLVAAVATVLAISLYAGSVFRSTGAAAVALGVFGSLYALIYVLMRMEDFALLAGSVASFLAIIATMWMTRNLDWYGPNRAERAL